MNSEPLHNSSSFASESPDVSPVLGLKQWPKSFKHQPRWIQYPLVCATGLLVVVGSVAGYQTIVNPSTETSLEQNTAIPVETIAIERVSSYQVPRTYTGEISALRSSELGFERGGQLVQVAVDEGQRVNAGETIARLDIRNLATQRLQVEAQKAQAIARLTELQNGARVEDIAEAEAAVRDLEKQLILQETQERRREYLFERGAISREQLDEFAFGADSLQAKLDQARSRLQELQNGTRFEQVDAQRAVVNQLDAQLEDIDVNISKSTITAPYDAIVATRKADEGTVVGAGQSVVELVESTVLEARIGIPADVADQIQLGQTEMIQVNGQPYTAGVAAVLPKVDPSTRTQTIVFELGDTVVGEIEPGQTARLTIEETIESDGFWLPRGALTQGIRGLWTSYVVVPASEYQGLAEEPLAEASSVGKISTHDNSFVVEQRSVEIIQQETTGNGLDTNTRVLVRGTLQSGDQVVTSGVHRLVPKQRVTAVVSE